MQVGEEVSVHHTALPGFAPFPTWNGTLAAASGAHDGRCSLLRENGDVVLLQYTGAQQLAIRYPLISDLLAPATCTQKAARDHCSVSERCYARQWRRHQQASASAMRTTAASLRAHATAT